MGVTICEVGPRDGLQNASRTFSPSLRAELVNRLAQTGLARIEAVAFVRADHVPQMADAEAVVAAIQKRDGISYAGLVLNSRGYERLRQTRLDRVNAVLAASETFNQRNGNMSLAHALDDTQATITRSTLPVTLTIAVAFGCPYEGVVDPGAVAALCDVVDADEIVLADSIGSGTPTRVRQLVERVQSPGRTVGVHLHNTRNTGYANAIAALEGGATLFDASIGGLGGCPFAPGATGNVATEDLVHLLEWEGVATGVDLDLLTEVSRWLEPLVGEGFESSMHRVGASPGYAW